MNINPTEFVAGIVVATTLLIVGLGIGWLLGRRSGDHTVLPEMPERRHVIDFVRNFAAFTSEFAGDFSQYQAKLTSLSQEAESKGSKATPDDIQWIIKELLDANRNLQTRLESAEQRLEAQTRELTAYLTEARTDALTGLPNRRALDAYLDQSFNLWKEKRLVFSLALVDIDFFKSINDTYGHHVGDTVLKEIAKRLQKLSNSDFKLGRYGGEEFAVLMPCSLKIAASNIERLRIAIADSPVAIESESVRITISCGVGEIRGDERIGTLFRRTDEALYSAKVAGRNRVFIHSGSICEPYGNPGEPERVRARVANEPAADGKSRKAISQFDATRKKLQARFDEIVSKEIQRPS
jgi:diguanylate cyclase